MNKAAERVQLYSLVGNCPHTAGTFTRWVTLKALSQSAHKPNLKPSPRKPPPSNAVSRFMTFLGSFPFVSGKEIYASVRLAYIPLPIRHDRMEPETSL